MRSNLIPFPAPSQPWTNDALARVLEATTDPAMTALSPEDVIGAHMDTRYPVNLAVTLAVVRHTNR